MAAGYSTTQVEALYRTMEERFHTVPGVLKVYDLPELERTLAPRRVVVRKE